MGNLSLLKGDTATAGNFYIRALRENVFLSEPRLNLVQCYQDMGHFEKAMTAYEEYVAVARMNRWGKVALASLAPTPALYRAQGWASGCCQHEMERPAVRVRRSPFVLGPQVARCFDKGGPPLIHHPTVVSTTSSPMGA